MNPIEYIHKKDMIAALATGGGTSALAVIRCSGNGVIDAISTIFKPFKKENSLKDIAGYRLVYGNIYENNSLIDQVILSIYRNPNSFTGEDIVEISCHGSVFIQKKILNLLSNIGIRPANPGEFTMRAWTNGKYDLAQAEAIVDLIESSNESAHMVAMRHLKGQYSSTINELREEFIHFASLLELELDFSEEDVEFADRFHLQQLIKKLKYQISDLLHSYTIGKVLKEGIPVAIIGKPNVGKSTLLNALLKDDKAITSEIPGTTRDIIEDTMLIDGFLFRFIDTAGIRQSNDTIENLGIQRTLKALTEATIIIYMIDENGFDSEDMDRIANFNAESRHLIIVQNKADKQNSGDNSKEILKISALNGLNINKLSESLLNIVGKHNIKDHTIVTSARHAALLKNTLDDLAAIESGFEAGIPLDLITIDVRSAMQQLGAITGQIVVDDLLANIFGKFCIGK